MKSKILVFYLFTGLFFYGCDKEPVDPWYPNTGFSIFKTKIDYSDKLFIALDDGKTFYVPSYYGLYLKDGDSIFFRDRVKLINGYILDRTSGFDAVATDYTINEYYNLEYVQKTLPSKKELQNRIIDFDPFLEYYQDIRDSIWFQPSDTAFINEIIRTNQIEKYFKKIK